MLLGEGVCDRGALREAEPDQDLSQRRAALSLLRESDLELGIRQDTLVHKKLAELKPSRFRRHALL